MHGQRHTVQRNREPCGAVGARRARERAIRELAARQHGVVTRAQLLELGVEPGAIDRRLTADRLRALHRGVYLVESIAPPRAREMAAVLSCGEGAVLSHRSAVAVWQMLPHPAQLPDVEVTVAGRDPGRRPGVRVHRVRSLERDEVRTCQRIPITTPARTLLDLAAYGSRRELEQAAAEAQRRGLTTKRQLLALVGRYPTRHGAPALKRLAGSDEQPALTRSEAEERLLDLIRRAELTAPEVNMPLCGFEVDFLWRQEGLVVEVDGYAYHSDPHAFERDRRRDAVLAAHGYRVIRVTWRRIVDFPAAVVARVAQALTASSSSV
jgi:very-short-patch-repair endonuclease/predicted transcriptional regulator of viral defense system